MWVLNMFNYWLDLIELEKDFPIGTKVDLLFTVWSIKINDYIIDSGKVIGYKPLYYDEWFRTNMLIELLNGEIHGLSREFIKRI
jgi:hypothetical protein